MAKIEKLYCDGCTREINEWDKESFLEFKLSIASHYKRQLSKSLHLCESCAASFGEQLELFVCQHTKTFELSVNDTGRPVSYAIFDEYGETTT